MPVTLINPSGLATPPDLYTAVSISTGSTLVFLAGQVAIDRDGRLIGEGDFAAQLEQCIVNAGTALAEIGGSFEDVAKITIYAVGWTPAMFPLLEAGLSRGYATLGIPPARPPGSLIGVASLSVPEHLVEVEAVAVID